MKNTVRIHLLAVAAALAALLALTLMPTLLFAGAATGGGTASMTFVGVTVPQTADSLSSPRVPAGARIEVQPVIQTNSVVSPGAAGMTSTALRWLEFVALLTLVGAIIQRVVVLHDAALPADVTADAADRTRRLALGVVALFLAATLTRAMIEANILSASADGQIQALLSVVRDTGWGHAWIIGFIGALLVLSGLVAGRGSAIGWIIAGIGVAAMATSEALTGHPAMVRQRLPLAVAVDVAHVLGAGGWIGGLAALMLAALPARRSLPDDERPDAALALVRAYHRTATDCVIIVIATALIATWLRIAAVSQLWTTEYGSLLVRKTFFVVVLLGVGAYHWRAASAGEWNSNSTFRYQRLATFALLVGGIVVAITAMLVAASLPTY